MELDARQLKQAAIDLLNRRLAGKRQLLEDIDPRLWTYFDDLSANSSADPDDKMDWHNIFEILGGAKFLRMLTTYPFNKKKVQTVLKLREGEWQRDGKMWRHIQGGLRCPGTSGAQYYRWQPFQVLVFASVFGFMSWVNTENEAGTKPELLPTERERDGFIWDYRRVCTEFVYFGPRKTDKTGLSAYIQFIFFFFEDTNGEAYCCANSSDQAKLLFSRTRQLIAQMDDGNRIRSTQTVVDWKQQYKTIRDTSVRPLSAGGKTKDGMFAQLCCADEFGSAPYTNGKSDMLALVNVIQSSMGPRREPLTFITTTAGTITSGPFMEKLDAIHRTLLLELTYEDGTGENHPDFESDRRMALCLEPDEWEFDEEVILTKKSLRRKVNPMLGLIVQHASYDGWISEARNDQTKMPELIAKYFNHYQSSKMTDWIKPEEIRAIQVPQHIDDCTADQGWEVMVGSDFSKGDDLNGNSYLAKRWRDDLGEYEYFADLDAYMSEEAVNANPLRELLLKWAQDGWLHIVPGKTFDPAVAVNRIIDLDSKNVNFFGFGYDPYNAKTVINALTQWLVDVGLDPKTLIRPVRQNFATYTPAVKEFDFMIHRGTPTADGHVEPNPMIHLSQNPLWPWEFGNCQLAESTDGMENMKPVKANASAACKVDNVQMLLSALILHDMADGNLQST